jgi:hypothetical protein
MSEHLRAGVVVVISVIALAGCGDDASQSEPAQTLTFSEATTEEAGATTAAKPPHATSH